MAQVIPVGNRENCFVILSRFECRDGLKDDVVLASGKKCFLGPVNS